MTVRHSHISWGLAALLGSSLSVFTTSCGSSGGDDASSLEAGTDAPGPGTNVDSGQIIDTSRDGGRQGDGDHTHPEPEFEGIDATGLPTVPPAGCEKGFDSVTKKLTLTLDDTNVPKLLLAVNAGEIQANGVTCTDAAGNKATTVNTLDVSIVGSAGGNTILVDSLGGTFGSVLDGAGIHIDGGAGADLVQIRGTRSDDPYAAGTVGTSTVIDLTGKKTPNVTIDNAEGLVASLGPGNDSFLAGGGGMLGTPVALPIVAYGGVDDDVLEGGLGDDDLHGGWGDDTLMALATADGSDVYDGGDDLDVIDYSKRTQSLNLTLDDMDNDGEADEGDNIATTVEDMYSGTGDDTLTGSAVSNWLRGGKGNDHLNGGDGDDIFDEAERGDGTDVINGGTGVDMVTYEGRKGDVTVTLCSSPAAPVDCKPPSCLCAPDDGEAGEGDTLTNVESVVGGLGNDTLTGDENDNILSGSDGDDILNGNGGDDTLYGDNGNDQLIGGAGSDLLDGELGLDDFDGGPGEDICIAEPREHKAYCEL